MNWDEISSPLLTSVHATIALAHLQVERVHGARRSADPLRVLVAGRGAHLRPIKFFQQNVHEIAIGRRVDLRGHDVLWGHVEMSG